MTSQERIDDLFKRHRIAMCEREAGFRAARIAGNRLKAIAEEFSQLYEEINSSECDGIRWSGGD